MNVAEFRSGLRAWLAAHRGPDAEAIMRLNPRYAFFSAGWFRATRGSRNRRGKCWLITAAIRLALSRSSA